MTSPNRKPRIALMGEFSSGKSTLSNLLLGARPLPEKVTATRLSPVWMSEGTEAPYRVDIDGHEELISIDHLDGIPVEETRVIRLFFESDVLELCDLIDFPGISDPNMSSNVWQRMLDEVDAIIWCTHATQAWRQSEASVWDMIPQAVRERSILLVTKFDKLTNTRDAHRVLARLNKETEGLFGATFPISLTAALTAGDDYAAFDASGGIDFLQYFLQMVESLTEAVGDSDEALFAQCHTPKTPQPVLREAAEHAVAAPKQDAVSPEPSPSVHVAEMPRKLSEAPAPTAEEKPEEPVAVDRVVPRRVKPKNGGSRHMRARILAEESAMSASTLSAYAGSAAARPEASPKLRAIFDDEREPIAAEE